MFCSFFVQRGGNTETLSLLKIRDHFLFLKYAKFLGSKDLDFVHVFFFFTQKLYINALEIYINNAPVSNESWTQWTGSLQ